MTTLKRNFLRKISLFPVYRSGGCVAKLKNLLYNGGREIKYEQGGLYAAKAWLFLREASRKGRKWRSVPLVQGMPPTDSVCCTRRQGRKAGNRANQRNKSGMSLEPCVFGCMAFYIFSQSLLSRMPLSGVRFIF